MTNHPGELKIPPIAEADKASKEIVRIWTGEEGQQFIIRHRTWGDPTAWGLCLVDIARHVSRAFAQEGHDEKEVLEKIIHGFKIETENPTDTPTGEIEK